MGTIAFVVEELSPGERVSEVRRRVERFRQAGVPLIWLLDPEERAVLVYRAGGISEFVDETEELVAGDVLPGFHCLAGEFFTPPGRNQGATE